MDDRADIRDADAGAVREADFPFLKRFELELYSHVLGGAQEYRAGIGERGHLDGLGRRVARVAQKEVSGHEAHAFTVLRSGTE